MTVYREYTIRFKKYNAKFDPDVVRARFAAVKDLAMEQVQGLFEDLVAMEKEVKALLNELGVPVTLIPMYLSYARQLWHAKKRHTAKTLKTEVEARKALWSARGLDPAILDEIAKLVVGSIIYY